MKAMKNAVRLGILGVVLAFSSNSLLLAETALKKSLMGSEKADNVVHRVNNAIALSQTYSIVPLGYKWGQEVYKPNSDIAASGSASPLVGYKWGRSNTAEQAGSKWGRSNTAEQAGSKWGRSNTAEQAGSKWGRS